MEPADFVLADHYTSREIKRWNKVKAYFDKLNKFLADNPTYMLVVGGYVYKTRVFTYRTSRDSCGVPFNISVGIQEENCYWDHASINVICEDSIEVTMKGIKEDIKVFKEVRIK